MKRTLRNNLFILAATLLFFFPQNGFARTIVDMTGRTVTVPDVIKKIYGSSPPATNLIYAVDPGKIAGLNSPLRDGEKKFTDPRLYKLPVVGGWFGQGQTPNMESLLAVHPDLLLVWQNKQAMRNEDIERLLAPLNAPVVFVALEHLDDYPAVFRFMGRLLGQEKRTEILATYAEKTLSDMKILNTAIPEKDRVTVYYEETRHFYSLTVVMAGIIGWVGLVVPHITRMLVGPDNRVLIPAAALTGALYLLAMDDLSRLLFSVEIPLGILTALCGIPFFVLVPKNARKGWG